MQNEGYGNFFFAILVVALLFLIIKALITGEVRGRWGNFTSKEESPLKFWFAIIVQIMIVIVMITFFGTEWLDTIKQIIKGF
ncbi:MAG: hypothetical protein ACLFSQ_10630 [Candidatus Zixiibacteriota bacterium]